MDFWDKLRSEWNETQADVVLTFSGAVSFEDNFAINERFRDFAADRSIDVSLPNWQFKGLTWGAFLHKQIRVKGEGHPGAFFDEVTHFQKVQCSPQFEIQIRQFAEERGLDKGNGVSLVSTCLLLTSELPEIRSNQQGYDYWNKQYSPDFSFFQAQERARNSAGKLLERSPTLNEVYLQQAAFELFGFFPSQIEAAALSYDQKEAILTKAAAIKQKSIRMGRPLRKVQKFLNQDKNDD